MLTRLALENFKSWRATGDIKLAPITGLFGSNSSGKTSIIQSLLLLKQTADSSDRGLVLHFGDKTTPVDLGDFKSVVFSHDLEAKLVLKLGWRAASPFEVTDTKSNDETVVSDSELAFSVTVHQESGAKSPRLHVDEMLYKVGSAGFSMRPKVRAKSKADYELEASNTGFRFVHSLGRKWPLPPPVKSYGFPDQVRAYFQNAGFLADLELAFENLLRNVYYLGPLRAYPERRYTWAGAQPVDMGRAGQSVVDAILASRDEEIDLPGFRRKRLTLEAYVAQWLKDLGLIHDFRVAQLAEGSQVFQVLVRKSSRSAEVLITDVGFGVSQILPVLVLCFYVPEGSTVILEQPEIHLHPAVQAGLADVLIDAWKKRRVQILLESHSEHLLRRLQRRVAEEGIQPEDLALYFCSAPEGESILTPLELDLFGNIANWPLDFFGDQLGEVAAAQKARLRRKSADRDQ